MRFQRWSVVALGMAITLISPTSSFGDSTPSPTPRPTLNIQNSKAAYKSALSMFKVEVKSREQIRNEINQIFEKAVNKANRKAKNSMKLAKNASAKLEISLQQDNAILLASKIRAASILVMGDALELLENPKKDPETQGDQPVKSEKRDSEPTKKAKPKK